MVQTNDISQAYQPIENYGVIGNLQTVALVGMNGSIDFMCFPDFDSPSVFAALLDAKKGGFFKISPAVSDYKVKQLYYPNTNILLTRFLFAEGVGEVTDFMPITKHNFRDALIRRVKVVRGEIRFRLQCAPRFDYGRAKHSVEKREDEIVFISKNSNKLAFRLRANVPLEVKSGDAFCEFILRAGETADFVFEELTDEIPSHADLKHHCHTEFDSTTHYWQHWLSCSKYKGRWREMVDRSALTLKMMTSIKHGSMIASPTFGLPERVGGERNWDYRYTWIRDASFTLYALVRLGFTDEAGAFMNWIEARCAECSADGSIQIMYGIDGRRDLKETTLTHFEGYYKSSPVRIGNGAAQQLQLDIYGELLDSIHLYEELAEPISGELWTNVARMTDWVCQNWKRKDEGIWETRGGQQEFLYSRVMCWVAIDRAVRIAIKRSFPAPVEQWRKERDAIYQDIYTNFWNPQLQAFVQTKGSSVLDASTLMMPLVHIISPRDPKWVSTLAQIEKHLVSDSLVYRYRLEEGSSDGLTGNEGTFSLCSFWYCEVLGRSGHAKKARFFFEKMLSYANHLGLYSEELGPQGEYLGNMPQAFTHLALISAAWHLDKLLD